MKPCAKCAARRKALALKAEKLGAPVKGAWKKLVNMKGKPK